MAENRAPVILVAEDELLVGQVICDHLAVAGYTVEGPAATGAEALALAREKRPDLLILDVGLRGAMGGDELALILQAEMEVSVIFLTGYSRSEVTRRAAAVRGARILTKPVLSETLYAEVRAALAAKPKGP
jgi:DNA-binding response OmpR family regulator